MIQRPRALDLFCGAGGASMGLYRAGFDVTGVDIKWQKRYPFRFVRADALRLPLRLSDFDLIWASPPCQRYSRVWRGQEGRRANYPDLVGPVRDLLSGSPFAIIENVVGAPLRPDCVLTGAQFDLDIVRTRIFELNGFTVPFELTRQHAGTVSNGDLACVAGHGCNNAWNLKRGGPRKWSDLPPGLRDRLRVRNSALGWRAAMGIDWMTRDELREAIPPAYSEHIGRHAIKSMEARAY